MLMSIDRPIPAAELARDYTHQGWVGLCPVYVHKPTGDLIERNGVPEIWLILNAQAADLVNDLRPLFGLDRWPGWPVVLGEPLDAEVAL